MTQATATQSQSLQELEANLDRLIDRYLSAIRENIELKRQINELTEEKTVLLEKTTLAKTRVESLITRLKAMEQNS